MLFMGGAIGSKVAELEFTDEPGGQFASASTYTFTNADIGDEAADRLVVVVVCAHNNVASGIALQAVTIGGNAATIHANGNLSTGVKTQVAAIASLLVPSGATATIAAGFSANMQRCFIYVYRMVKYRSATPSDVETATALNSASVGDTLDIPSGGAAVAGACAAALLGTATFAGVNEDADENLGNVVAGSGHQHRLKPETGRAITVTEAGSTDTPEWAFAAAVWQ